LQKLSTFAHEVLLVDRTGYSRLCQDSLLLVRLKSKENIRPGQSILKSTHGDQTAKRVAGGQPFSGASVTRHRLAVSALRVLGLARSGTASVLQSTRRSDSLYPGDK